MTDTHGPKEFNRNLDLELDSLPDYNTNLDSNNNNNNLTDRKWTFKALALFCAIFFSAGSHFSTYVLNSLKTEMKSNMKMDNTQYGTAQAALYLINTIMPLVGGVFMDRFGTGSGAIISSSLILFGNLLVAISAHLQSFPLLIAGRIFHGLGSGVIVVAQETILGKWFSTSIIATVIGIQIASSRLFSFCAQAVSVPLARYTGFYGASLWVAVGICFLSWISTFIYAIVLSRAGGEPISPRTKGSSFSLRRLLYLPAGFWLMPFTILLLGGVWTPFLGSVTDFVARRFQSNLALAAWTGSVSLVVPVLLSPVMGGIIDKFGHRSIIVILSSLLCIISMVLLGFTYVTPFLGLTLFSFSLTIGPVALTSSVPLMLPPELVGTGIGIHKVGLSVGVALLHLIVGHIQDLTPDHSYDNVSILLTTISTLALLLSFAYSLYNRRHLHHLLDLPSSRRPDLLINHPHLPCLQPPHHSSPTPLPRLILTIIMLILILLTWIIFIWSLIENPASYLKRLKLN